MWERSPTRFRRYRTSGGCPGGGGGVNERVDVAYWVVTVEMHRNQPPVHPGPVRVLPATADPYTCPSPGGEASPTLARFAPDDVSSGAPFLTAGRVSPKKADALPRICAAVLASQLSAEDFFQSLSRQSGRLVRTIFSLFFFFLFIFKRKRMSTRIGVELLK